MPVRFLILTLISSLFFSAHAQLTSSPNEERDARVATLEAQVEELRAQVTALEFKLGMVEDPEALPYTRQGIVLRRGEAIIDPLTLLNVGIENISGNRIAYLIVTPMDGEPQQIEWRPGETRYYEANGKRYRLFLEKINNESDDNNDYVELTIVEVTE